MNIPEDQGKVLDGLASSGDESAKSWAVELGREPKPATNGDATKQPSGAADDAKPDGEGKPDGDRTKESGPDGEPKTEGEAKDGVDANRDGASDQGKRPSIYAEVRRLKQERRQLRDERDASRQREEALNSRLAALEARQTNVPDGSKPKDAEEDMLTRLLSKPEDVFREREKTLISAVRQAIKEDMAKARSAEESRAQKSSAIKTLESIKDFDLERDEDQVFEIMKQEYGLDEDDVEHLLATRPVKTAAWIKKAWEKKFSTAVSDKVMADKASARSGPSLGGGASHSKVTLEQLNARAKGAKTKEDLDKAWDEVGKLS